MKRKDILYAVLGGFFLTNALLAEMIGGKLIFVGPPDWKIGPLGPFKMSVGIIPWPVVFVTTDLVNEYFGRRGVRRLTFLAVGMIAYAFLVLFGTICVPAASGPTVQDNEYNRVFGQSLWIIVGSLTAFLIAQFIDVTIFHLFRKRTGRAQLWLRATGSTVFSQLIDTVIVLYIGLALPLNWSTGEFLSTAAPNYTVKLAVALLMTPLIYLGHWAVERFLGKTVADQLADEAAADWPADRTPPG